MSITSAMYVGISGLQAQSQNASVVSNNLANAATTAYKSSSTNFEDVFSSTIYSSGGTDQVGNGVRVSSVDIDWSQGSYEDSSSVLDMAINGDGFFVVSDPDTGDIYYTRDGNFELDVDGYLVDSHGNRVQGWDMDDGSISGSVGDICINQAQSAPQATSEISLDFNLDNTSSDNTTSSNATTALFDAYNGTLAEPLDDSRYAYQMSITVYDESGSAHDVMVAADPAGTSSNGSTTWEYVVYTDPTDDMRTVDGVDVGSTSSAGLLMTGTITFTSSGEMSSMTAFTLDDTLTNSSDLSDPANWTLADFDNDGNVTFDANFTGGDGQTISFDIGLSNTDSSLSWDTSSGIDSLDDITAATSLTDLPTFAASTLSTSASTSYDTSSAIYSSSQDGYTSGTLQDLEVSENGVITGLYSNGQSVDLYAVSLADFTNTDGLYSEGSNLWSATTESGQALIGQAGTSGFGTVASNSLEGSNVDTATEMTELVILQSVYQANSKVITTADTMLQVAIGLKS